MTSPFVLCWDGSDASKRAIQVSTGLLGTGRKAKLLYVYKPMERSFGVAQALTGGRIDAPVSGETDAHEQIERGVAFARDVGFDAEPVLVAADRSIAEIITATAEDVDAPAIVMGQRGRSGLKTALLGSVSRDVVNAYHRPVIIV
jgi:nucleotide-binding universal stress UspA family protein